MHLQKWRTLVAASLLVVLSALTAFSQAAGPLDEMTLGLNQHNELLSA